MDEEADSTASAVPVGGMPTAVERSPTRSALDGSASDLSRRLQRREVSCREVMQQTLARVSTLNPQVNALVSLRDGDVLMREADAADLALQRGERRGWMHGFPLAVKDLSAAEGLPTSMGSPLHANDIAVGDALFVQRMKRAGAIVIGKSNTPEFGLGSHTYNKVFGTTFNAHAEGRTAGGSSGGAAVAVALRMLPVADGSDMGGSLRNPAAFNNVYGFRPSLGRVPSLPSLDVFWKQLGTEGPIARSPDDLARLLAVQAGADARAPLALDGTPPDPDSLSLNADIAGLRIGWLGSIWPDLPLEAGIIELCRRGLQVFADSGCHVADARLAFARERSWRAWTVLRQFFVGGMLGAAYDDPARRALLKPEAIWEIEGHRRLQASDIYRASIDRTALFQAMHALFDAHDVLVAPTAQVFPFDAALHWPRTIEGVAMDSYHRWMEIVTPMTMAGLPTLAVPLGFDDRGLPMGMQLVGRPRSDFDLLAIGQRYHEATQWPQRVLPAALRSIEAGGRP